MRITREQYYIAKGLFHLASEHQRQCMEYEKTLYKLLGVDDGSHVSDEIYSPSRGLDEALRLAGVTVEDDVES